MKKCSCGRVLAWDEVESGMCLVCSYAVAAGQGTPPRAVTAEPRHPARYAILTATLIILAALALLTVLG